jgi:bifunctional UDP-N-acetylglucosamine pyrophosphorylase/glucosamine-1-phosphate N-acetyltransferase
MANRPLLILILAAGKGTRMRSAVPKVLHKIAGRSMLAHVLALSAGVHADRTAVIIGPGMEDVRAEALRQDPAARVYVQGSPLGTADAVLAAREAIAEHRGDVLILYSDTPLLEAATITRLLDSLDRGAGIALLGFEAEDPAGYGRLITAGDGTLLAIREDADASEAERSIRLCNSGVMAFRLEGLLELLTSISNRNAKGEYYLTDAIAMARQKGAPTAVIVCPEEEVLGINSREELATAEAIWQRRARRKIMAEGATLIAPETVWLCFDTVVGRDVVIEPNVFFGPGVTVDDGAEILANCYVERSRIGRGARIGPFSRLRPGADLKANVHIGNFVEVKNVVVGEGAKANHLSYLGDGSVGAGANIGAGTIFCNYDGFLKHRTEIGAGAFIGSNTSLVAPIKIGEGAYIGSGSVITKDVAPDALALERSPQTERPGWAAKFRALMARRKAKAS